MIRVLGRATSANVQAVMWLAGELGLEHERIDLGHVHGGLDAPAFLAKNPNGLVPVLDDGDLALFESGAINRYLAARHGAGGPFWPEDPALRATADMWAEWGKTTLGPAFTRPIFWVRARTAAKDRDEAALSASIARFEALLRIAADQLGDKPFLIGDELCLADIMLGHLLFRYYDIDIPRAAPDVTRTYYERLAERPAYRDHVMVSHDALRVPGA